MQRFSSLEKEMNVVALQAERDSGKSSSGRCGRIGATEYVDEVENRDNKFIVSGDAMLRASSEFCAPLRGKALCISLWRAAPSSNTNSPSCACWSSARRASFWTVPIALWRRMLLIIWRARNWISAALMERLRSPIRILRACRRLLDGLVNINTGFFRHPGAHQCADAAGGAAALCTANPPTARPAPHMERRLRHGRRDLLHRHGRLRRTDHWRCRRERGEW